MTTEVFTDNAYDLAIERQGGKCPGCNCWLLLGKDRWLQQTNSAGDIWVMCEQCGREVDRLQRELVMGAAS